MLHREKKLLLINKNLLLIKEYLNDLTADEIDQLFNNLDDIFFFYGIKRNEIIHNIKAGAINDTTTSGLSELYGVTNAIIFQLKYKMNFRPKDQV